MPSLTCYFFIMWFFFSYQDKDFFDKCRQEYLQKREDFQKDYVQSGKVKDLKKKDSVILWGTQENSDHQKCYKITKLGSLLLAKLRFTKWLVWAKVIYILYKGVQVLEVQCNNKSYKITVLFPLALGMTVGLKMSFVRYIVFISAEAFYMETWRQVGLNYAEESKTDCNTRNFTLFLLRVVYRSLAFFAYNLLFKECKT